MRVSSRRKNGRILHDVRARSRLYVFAAQGARETVQFLISGKLFAYALEQRKKRARFFPFHARGLFQPSERSVRSGVDKKLYCRTNNLVNALALGERCGSLFA